MAINALALDKHAHTGGQDNHCVSVSLCLSGHILALRVSHMLRDRDMETLRGIEIIPRETGSKKHILLEAK